MQVFTIRDIENLTGIKAHTLRIWEQRYRLMARERELGHHRSYSNEDLKQLLKISTLYHNGYKISKIAALNRDDMGRLALDTLVVKDPYSVYVNQLVEASVDFDESRFDQVIHTCILHYSFEKTIFRVLFPFLNKIGLLWMTGHVVPAMEHLASALIRKKILVAIDGVEKPRKKSDISVVLFTPEDERHELPILMMQYLLRKSGVHNSLLGQCVSINTLETYCQAQPASHLYAHIITYLQKTDIDDYVAKLSSHFPDKKIILSGSVVQGLTKKYGNVKVLKTTEEMVEFASQIM